MDISLVSLFRRIFGHEFLASRWIGVWCAICGMLMVMTPTEVKAVPAFARQTGQNCLACHAGGQFPELTPYGRFFKMTGYTIGSRALPLSIMGVVSNANVADTSKTDDPSADFQKNGTPILATGSVFLAGKVTNNIGAFTQVTYDNYASQDANGSFHGHTQADNMDIRYAEHWIDGTNDVIFGVSLNNNPSVTDPWNTAAAWMQYVPVPSPTAYQFIDGNTPFPGFGAGGNIAGLNAYLYWNKSVYGELGLYRTANRALSFMSAGIDAADTTNLDGTTNPYWRLAYTRDWGAHNLMVGASGMYARVYDLGSDTSDSANLSKFHNTNLDVQYQYLLDPHTITAQFVFAHQTQAYSPNSLAGVASPYFLSDGVTPVAAVNGSDRTNTARAKLSYVYEAQYGGSFAYFSKTGSTNTLNQTSGYDSNGQITSTDPLGTGITSTRVTGSLSGNPATKGVTLEAFWLPVQYMRVGVQYTDYFQFNGASSNYDGFGRNAKDNNTLFLYLWAAY